MSAAGKTKLDLAHEASQAAKRDAENRPTTITLGAYQVALAEERRLLTAYFGDAKKLIY